MWWTLFTWTYYLVVGIGFAVLLISFLVTMYEAVVRITEWRRSRAASRRLRSLSSSSSRLSGPPDSHGD